MQIEGYSVNEKINKNPNISVFKGTSVSSNQEVVIKYVELEEFSAKYIINLKNEYEILRSLESDFVIKAYSFEQTPKGYLLSLEYGGISLKEYYLKKSELSLEEFLKIGIRLADILAHIHRKRVIHKDIKPANFVINESENKIKVIDFGISSCLSREEVGFKSLNILEGSLPYISPEQTGRVNKMIDYRSDFYSLGITFYELLTRTLPFSSDDPVELVYNHITQYPPKVTNTNHKVPVVLSEIINKLMAKNPEERYQSAIGLKKDLEFCLKNLQEKGTIPNFSIGQQDISDRFQIPQKLYGRESDINKLLSIFDEVVKGKSSLLLVSGFSGIGKSAFIHETHKPITGRNGYFIKGKFDQFQRNIPFSAIVQAFRSLMNYLLTETEAQLEDWRKKLQKAVGFNGQVIVDVIPELEFVIGEQKPVAELGPTETQNRFHITFQNFISVFTRKEHPIVLFIDDLQWADTPSLNLIKLMVTDTDSKYLMIIGAYRDNEIDAVHPLTTTINDIKNTGKEIETIHLGSLTKEDIVLLVSDTLHTKDINKLKPLADLLYTKTGGNPFFLAEFLKTLYKEELIFFDYEQLEWKWQESKILSYGITDNVIDLMVKKLSQLPEETRYILSYAACLGSQFDIEMLSVIVNFSAQKIASSLLPAIDEGMLIPEGGDKEIRNLASTILVENSSEIQNLQSTITIRFQHDRVQQAAYTFISEDKKKETHLKIGRLLLEKTKQEELEEKLFDIVSQLNKGVDLIVDELEKKKLAELNLKAAKKAKISTSYNSANYYLKIGRELFNTANSWKDHYELLFELTKEAAECECLVGNYKVSDQLMQLVFANAKTKYDKSEIYMEQIVLLALQAKYKEAVDVSIQVLRLFDFYIPEPEKNEEIQQLTKVEIDKFLELMNHREVSSLFDLPINTEEDPMYISKIFTVILDCLVIGVPNLLALYLIKITNWSIVNGLTSCSPFVFATLAIIITAIFKDYKRSLEFTLIGKKINNEKIFNDGTKAKINHLIAYFSVLNNPLNTASQLHKKTFQLGIQFGDLVYCAYSIHNVYEYVFVSSIPETNNEVEKMLTFYKKIKHPFLLLVQMYRGVLLRLQDYSEIKTELSYSEWNEEEFLTILKDAFSIIALYKKNKLILFNLFDKKEEAIGLVMERNAWVNAFVFDPFYRCEYYFYSALVIASVYESQNEETKVKYIEILNECLNEVQQLADVYKPNFYHYLLVIQAEIAKIEKTVLKAINLYEEAIIEARKNGFLLNEALYNELCANFWLENKSTKYAAIHLKESHHLYRRWGAIAKVRLLEEKYPELLSYSIKTNYELPHQSQSKREIDIEKTISVTTYAAKSQSDIYSQSLDLSSILKASQAISGEIEYERLMEKLVKIVLETAGAERVVFVSYSEDRKLLVEAEGTAKGKKLYTDNPKVLREMENELPVSVIQFSARAKKQLVLNDAFSETQFKEDIYIKQNKIQSIFCSPIVNKGKLAAVIYMENNATTGAFTEQRVETIHALASQAAISIENAKLYANIENVTREKTRISTEMDIAEQIQTSLLVEKPVVKGYNVLPYMKTADEVGGDYYDVINDGDRDWFVIGDVSGHGVTAGLIMMMVQTALHTVIETAKDLRLAEKMKKVNHVISENIKMMKLDKYMTLTLLLREKDTFYFSGLHQDILIYRNDKQTVETVETTGAWLGLEGMLDDFYVNSFSMFPGDVMLLYTDGVTEATHKQTAKMLLTEGLKDFFVEVGDKPNEEIKEAILQLLDENYITKDDVTFMLVRKD